MGDDFAENTLTSESGGEVETSAIEVAAPAPVPVNDASLGGWVAATIGFTIIGVGAIQRLTGYLDREHKARMKALAENGQLPPQAPPEAPAAPPPAPPVEAAPAPPEAPPCACAEVKDRLDQLHAKVEEIDSNHGTLHNRVKKIENWKKRGRTPRPTDRS